MNLLHKVNSEKHINNERIDSGQTRTKRIGNYLCFKNQVLSTILDKNRVIYLGKNTNTNEDVSIENIPNREAVDSQMKNLVHAAKYFDKNIHLLKIIDILQTENNFYVVSQVYDQNLNDFLKNRRVNMTIAQAFKFLVQIINGYTNLRSKGLLHLNLCPQNIVLHNGTCKISGFQTLQSVSGLDQMKDKNMKTEFNQFLSPESYYQGKYSQKSDIWSIGSLLYYMLTGLVAQRLPDSDSDIIRPNKCTEMIWTILSGTLKFNPHERFSLYQLRQLVFSGEKPRSLKLIEDSYSSNKAISLQISSEKEQSRQNEEYGILKTEINFIYFIDKVLGISANNNHLSFYEELNFLLQYYIRMRISVVKNQLKTKKQKISISNNFSQLESLLQEFNRISQQYSQNTIQGQQLTLQNDRIKLFSTQKNHYPFSENLTMQFHFLLKKHILSLNNSLQNIVSEEEVLNHQTEIMLLDYLITTFQLNSLIIEFGNCSQQFKENSCLQEMVEAPAIINLQVYMLVREKIQKLRLF